MTKVTNMERVEHFEVISGKYNTVGI